jgi:Na+-transporting NADH:ubiquinone oxidoreductase subunit NqrE
MLDLTYVSNVLEVGLARGLHLSVAGLFEQIEQALNEEVQEILVGETLVDELIEVLDGLVLDFLELIGLLELFLDHLEVQVDTRLLNLSLVHL